MVSNTYQNRKIIVLTPVKNEAWILDRFLKVTSIFADYIIIADQDSTDGSLEIYKKFPKVLVIKNPGNKYNEDARQLLLITTARKKFGLGNILLAIDADEILAANAMETLDWQKMISAPIGTILYFEKPTFYKSTQTAIRYFGEGWPLGYVDDGAKHNPTPIHSVRIPHPPGGQKLILSNIKFLHYALIRLDALASKRRMYSMIENIYKTKSIRLRRRSYNSNEDFRNEGDKHDISSPHWFTNWEKIGIDMHSVTTNEYYWYDIEALKIFKTYGIKRFYRDDIWNCDWEKIRIDMKNHGHQNIPENPIIPPNKLYLSIINSYYSLMEYIIFKIKNINHLKLIISFRNSSKYYYYRLFNNIYI